MKNCKKYCNALSFLNLRLTAACMKRWGFGAENLQLTTQPMRGINFE